jgi:glycogen debranching enzyme
MIIRHVSSIGEIRGNLAGYGSSFLRGKSDWFSQFILERATRYEGWFLTDEADQPHQFWKFIERIELFPSTKQLPQTVTVGDNATAYRYSDGTEVSFQLAPNLTAAGGLCLSSNAAVEMQLTLDMRGIYLQPQDGREYTIAPYKSGLLITYTDPLLNGRKLFIILQSPDGIKLSKEPSWQQVYYGRDAKRNSEPSSLYVYTFPPLATQKLFLGIGCSLEKAEEGVRSAETLAAADFSQQLPTTTETELSLLKAEKALEKLHVSSGYYAGLPWFHQHWSRDELITALGLPLSEKLRMLERYLETPLYQGELPTYIGSGTYCADGVGWLALLVKEIGLEQLNDTLKAKLTTFLQASVLGLDTYRKTPTGLIWSGHNATWMDTIGRVGCRVEIQTMYGLCLQLLHQLTGQESWQLKQLEHREAVRHLLFHDFLRDGLEGDASLSTELRPNVFLAYLLQPKLLSESEWHTTFSLVLAACRTPWGGLTSLQTDSKLFQAQSTGENNLSYHQGDSWFHINCLAALALHRLDKARYATTIEGLRSSACKELLWQHFLGCPGEIASAETGASWGCGIQGFAGGPLVKLLQETV